MTPISKLNNVLRCSVYFPICDWNCLGQNLVFTIIFNYTKSVPQFKNRFTDLIPTLWCRGLKLKLLWGPNEES